MRHAALLVPLCLLAPATASCPFSAGRRLVQPMSGRGGGGGGGGRFGGRGGGSPCFDKAAVEVKAAQRAGLTLKEALSIDEVNLYERLGMGTLKAFSTAFYTSFYADRPFYEELFKDHPLEDSIANQYTFLAQRFGGPQLFTERKGGPPRMLRRHAAYPCNDTTAQRWLHHSQAAFEEVGPAIDADSRARMERFFSYMAWYLVEGQAARQAAGCGEGAGNQGGGRRGQAAGQRGTGQGTGLHGSGRQAAGQGAGWGGGQGARRGAGRGRGA